LSAEEPTPGTVHLVGAGPGDPGLLTARALHLIATVDVILYDRLIPAEALQSAREDAELLFVGKEGGGPSVPQHETEDLLVERALSGKSVLRLKGGDPFVFGRGGEEALRLKQEGIAFEIVPGVTAGVAAPAHAGIPVTHRGLSTGVAFVTGHRRHDGEDDDGLDWDALAAFPGTLVLYMGVSRLEEISCSLIEAGRREDEPVAVIERGTLPDQRVIIGELRGISKVAAEQGVKAPAITVVGDVVSLADEISWRGTPPLAGVSVAVTRARPQASALALRLKDLGADVVQAPAIEIQPLEAEVPDLASYDLLCLTSPNGVEILFDRLSASGRDARALAGLTVAAIGPGTARALASHGVTADVIPERFVAEGLVQALRDVPVSRALIARAQEARQTLPEALRARGAEVDVLTLYRTVPAPLSGQALRRAASADYITFTSSSTVSFFLESSAAGDGAEAGSEARAGGEEGAGGAHLPLSPATRIVSIGPVTSQTLREHGLAPHVEALRHDIDGLVEALLQDARRRD